MIIADLLLATFFSNKLFFFFLQSLKILKNVRKSKSLMLMCIFLMGLGKYIKKYAE